jgi:hypothetical protein
MLRSPVGSRTTAIKDTMALPFDAATWPVISALLDEALALPAVERYTFVQQLDGERARYRDTLRALLGQGGGGEGVETRAFLDTLPALTGLAGAADGGAGALVEVAPGQTVGPYRLIRELGVGGMGAVWLAERADGALKRQVALKLPRLAWGRHLAQRMARERDILASLEHPHIARLYDAGIDQHGRPYLALEYVAGQSIDDYANERALATRQRLDLLLQVCGAVAYAHSRLIVHRDLKPSNILVNAEGQVRLLDFGIAKLIEDEREGRTRLTQLAGRALTLDYASPEQIMGAPIGTASDVYSLAVVAYELLVGSKPYRLKRGSAAELEEAIAIADVSPASSAAADAATKRALRGDLDAILNKALKRAPEERYATVDALAQDITRHLASEPVSAQPDAFLYRAGKFLQRYRTQVAAGSIAALALTAATVVALWQAQQAAQSAREAQASRQRAEEQAGLAQQQTAAALQAREGEQRAADAARQARDRAEALAQSERQAAAAAAAQARLAESEARRARAVRDYLIDLFRANSYQQGDAVDVQNLTARELLDRGATHIDRLASSDPAAHAYLLRTFGELYHEMALDDRSVQMLQRAAASLRSVRGPDHPETAIADMVLAWTLDRVGRRDEARRLVEQAKGVLERTRPRSPELAQALYFEATLNYELDPQRAAATAERSLRLLRDIGERGFRLAMAHNAHGLSLRMQGRTDDALAAFASTRAQFDAMFGAGNVESAHAAVEAMRTLAAARRWREAVQIGDSAIADLRRHARTNPAMPLRPMLTLSRALLGTGDGPRSRAVLVEALALRQAVADPAHRPSLLDVERFIALNDTARGDCEAALVALPGLRVRTPTTLHEDQIVVRIAEILCRLRRGELRVAGSVLAEAQAIAAAHRVSRYRQEDIARGTALLAAAQGDAAAATGALQLYESLAHPRDAALLRAQTAMLSSDLPVVRSATAPWLGRAPDAADADVLVDGELALLAAQAHLASDPQRALVLADRAQAALQSVLVPQAPQLATLAELRRQLVSLPAQR